MTRFRTAILAPACLVGAMLSAHTLVAQNSMPDLSSVSTTNAGPSTTAWYPDRAAPAGFTNVPSFEGRSNVLQETVSASDFNSSTGFYNTQGRKIDVNASGPSTFATDVFIDGSWATTGSGTRRTDLWATTLNATTVTGYPIIGFTNESGTGVMQFWDNAGGGTWTTLTSGFSYNAWNQIGFSWDGASNSVDYWLNGANVGSTVIDPGTTEVGNVMIQTHNFDNSYSSYYSNAVTTTPEPSSIALLGTGLFGLVPMIRRRRRK